MLFELLKYKNENEPFQIRVGGSGMMLIKREVFEKLEKKNFPNMNKKFKKI